MTKDLKKLFQNITQIEPPHELYERILARIRRIALVKFVIFLASTLASSVILVFSFQYAAQEFYVSGFSQYLSLIISDGDSLITYWEDLLISLAESLPILGMTLLLTSIFLLLGSVRLLAENNGISLLKTRFISH